MLYLCLPHPGVGWKPILSNMANQGYTQIPTAAKVILVAIDSVNQLYPHFQPMCLLSNFRPIVLVRNTQEIRGQLFMISL